MRTPDQSAAVMLHACLAPRGQVAGKYLALGRVASPDPVGTGGAAGSERIKQAQSVLGTKKKGGVDIVHAACECGS